MVVLGLVCLDAEGTIKYQTTTKKKYDTLSFTDKEKTLRKLYINNLKTFKYAIQYCKDNSIGMYRVTSNLFPIIGLDNIGSKLLDEFKSILEDIGNLAKTYNVRILIHADQFNVLSSDDSGVVANTIQNLHYHALTFDYMKLSETTYNLINIHGGKANRVQQLIKVVNTLPLNIKNRLTFENDEYSYTVNDLVQVYESTGVPVLFDFHHHLVNSKCISYNADTMKAAYKLASSTWEDKNIVTTHISNGANSFYDRKHSDYITNYPYYLDTVPYVEVESKAKNLAIDKLVALMR